jgi:hypothetical protein
MNNASNNIVGEKGKFLPFFGGHRVGKEVWDRVNYLAQAGLRRAV